MYKIAKPIYFICESPLHVGSGNEVGLIDLPIQRERHTNFPKIESSSLKGAIREFFEFKIPIDKDIQDRIKLHLLFGYDSDSSDANNQDVKTVFEENKTDSFSGAIGFSDAKLLLFPVRSARGIFAWVTCPLVLERFVNDLKLANILNIPIPPENTMCEQTSIAIGNKIILEEYTFEVKEDKTCTNLAGWIAFNVIPQTEEYKYIRDKIQKDLVVLSNEDFQEFVTHSTEVVTRTKIDNETGTVKEGALFTEEYLPQDSILYSLVFFSKPFEKYNTDNDKYKDLLPNEEKALEFFENYVNKSPVFQAGGNATLGKGLLRIQFKESKHEPSHNA